MIYFNYKEAREYLINHGFVYTLRDRPKGEGEHEVRHGYHYKFKKLGVANIVYIGHIKDIDIDNYALISGYGTKEDWLAAANGSEFLHFVEFVEEEIE